MLPPPEGLWGMPPEMLRAAAGLRPRCRRRTAPRRARSWRSSATARTSGSRSRSRPATSPAYPRPGGDPDRPAEADLYRRRSSNRSRPRTGFRRSSARTIRSALNNTGSGVDDPDQQFYENYACGSPRNYSGYCNPELDKMIRRAIDGDRSGEAQEAGLGDRQAACRRTGRGRSSSTPRGATCWQPVGQGRDDRWSTASTTAGAWRTSGSTSRRVNAPAAVRTLTLPRLAAWAPRDAGEGLWGQTQPYPCQPALRSPSSM